MFRSKLILSCTIFASVCAHALDVQLFRSALSGSRQGITQSHAQDDGTFLILGVTPGWVRNPIELGIGSNTKIDNVVSNLWTTNVNAFYQPKPFMFFSLDVPAALLNQIEPVGSSLGNKSSTHLGDILLTTGFRVLEDREHGTFLALKPFVSFPTGNSDQFYGNRSYTYGAWIDVSKYFKNARSISIDLGARFRKRETVYNLDIGNELLLKLLYRQAIISSWDLHALVEFFGSTPMDSAFASQRQTPGELTFALQKFQGSFAYALGAGRGLNNGYGAPDVRAFTNLSYAFRRKDKPQVPVQEALPGTVDILVQDEQERPITATIEIQNNDASSLESLESDHVEKTLPAEQYLGAIRAEGYYPAKIGFTVESGQKTPIVVQLRKTLDGKLNLLGKILFDLNRSNLKVEASTALKEAVDLLRHYPEIKKLKIEAHTDDRASSTYNLKLSQQRAKSVYDHLVSSGVSAERLVFEGMGEEHPIAGNDTEEGRAKNRRVDFIIVETQAFEPKVQMYFPNLYNR